MSYCKCGGYLGSGGVDGYAGRWCNCANPVQNTDTITTSTEFNFFRTVDPISFFPHIHHKFGKTPAQLKDTKGFNKEGLKDRTWYIALVAYSSNNPYHLSLYYSGSGGKSYSTFVALNTPDLSGKDHPKYGELLYEVDFSKLKFTPVKYFQIDFSKIEKEQE